MEALSEATLVELARAGPVRGDTPQSHADTYVGTVQCGLHKGVRPPSAATPASTAAAAGPAVPWPAISASPTRPSLGARPTPL